MNEYQQTLSDVRKSYRLLHDYQRLVLDACKFIGSQLQLEYAGGHQKFSDPPPRNGKGRLDRWAWDWLGMIAYEMHFRKETPEGCIMLSMFHIADTAACKVVSSNKRNTSTFANATTASKSMVIFIYHLTPKASSNSNGWNLDFFKNDEQQRIQFIDNCEAGNLFTQGAMQFLPVSVESIFTEDSARQIVSRLQQSFSALKPDQSEIKTSTNSIN